MFLALKKVGVLKITPPQDPFGKKSPPKKVSDFLLTEGNFPPPLTAIWKTLIASHLLKVTKFLV